MKCQAELVLKSHIDGGLHKLEQKNKPEINVTRPEPALTQTDQIKLISVSYLIWSHCNFEVKHEFYPWKEHYSVNEVQVSYMAVKNSLN